MVKCEFSNYFADFFANYLAKFFKLFGNLAPVQKLKFLDRGEIKSAEFHSEVGDRLLAVDTEFSIDGSGRIRDLYVDLHCPADFLQMIVETLTSCQGSEEIALPDDGHEAVKINSRFIQNFGPKFIDKSKN